METIKFLPGDKVLVNFPFSGYWPCRITRVLSKNWRKVKYLGEQKIGKAHVKVIREFNEDVKNNLEKYISKRKLQKNPMLQLAVLQINKKRIARNLTLKAVDVKEQIGVSDKMKNKGVHNNSKNWVLRSSSFSVDTLSNNNYGLDTDAGNSSASTSQNIRDNKIRTPRNKERKSKYKVTYTKYTPASVTSNSLSLLNSALFSAFRKSNVKVRRMNSALFSAFRKSNVKVRVNKPVPEQIMDVPKNNRKKSGEFKLVSSNVYKTCACQGMCLTDSCACVGYLQECQDACECSDNCENTVLTDGEGKRLFLATSDVHGTGCFANEDIKEGDFVGEYVGEIVSKFHAAKKRNQSKFLFLTGDKNFVIDASRFGSKLTRMNHKDENLGDNCEFKLRRVRGAWRVGVWALEDISKGVELFANYGEQYWE